MPGENFLEGNPIIPFAVSQQHYLIGYSSSLRLIPSRQARLAVAEAAAEQWRVRVLDMQEALVEEAMARWAAEHDKELVAASQELLAELRADR